MKAEFLEIPGAVRLIPENEIETAFLRWHQGAPWFANHTSLSLLRDLIVAPDKRSDENKKRIVPLDQEEDF